MPVLIYGKILVCIRQKMKEHEIEGFRLYSGSGLIKCFVKSTQTDFLFRLHQAFCSYNLNVRLPNINNLCNVLLSLRLFCLKLMSDESISTDSFCISLYAHATRFWREKKLSNLCKTVTSLWATRAKSSITHNMQKRFPVHPQWNKVEPWSWGVLVLSKELLRGSMCINERSGVIKAKFPPVWLWNYYFISQKCPAASE